MSNPYETANERRSILGPTIQFKGELSADEDLVILGQVDGAITHTQRLTVGAGGKVTATVSAQLVIVEGTIEGDVRATNSVVVKETANVRGNISAPSVSILQGATFNGGVDMESGKSSKIGDTAKLPAYTAA